MFVVPSESENGLVFFNDYLLPLPFLYSLVFLAFFLGTAISPGCDLMFSLDIFSICGWSAGITSLSAYVTLFLRISWRDLGASLQCLLLLCSSWKNG